MQTLELIESQLKEALRGNDWAKLDRIRDRMMSLVLRIVSGESNVDIALVREALQKAFAFGSTLPDFDGARNTSTEVWLVAEHARLAGLAESLLPKDGAVSDISARDRMLSFLSAANAKLSNNGLADRCGVTPETVARVLPVLRAEGLVRSRRVGRTMVNEITESGRAKIQSKTKVNTPLSAQSRSNLDVNQNHAPTTTATMQKSQSLNLRVGNRKLYIVAQDSTDVEYKDVDYLSVLNQIRNSSFEISQKSSFPEKVHGGTY